MRQPGKDELYRGYYNDLMECLYEGETDSFEKTFNEALADGFPVDYIPVSDLNRPTILQKAAYYCGFKPKKNRKVLQLLLDHGADISKTDSYGWPALIYACFFDGEHVPTDLFEQLIVPEQLNVLYKINERPILTPFDLMVKSCVREMQQTGHMNNSLPKLRLLLEAGADPSLAQENWDLTEERIAKYQNPNIVKEAIAEVKKLIATYQEQKYQQNNDRAEVYYDYEL